MFDVKLKITGMEQAKKLLDSSRYAKVAARVLNKASKQAGVEASRDIRERYNITKAGSTGISLLRPQDGRT